MSHIFIDYDQIRGWSKGGSLGLLDMLWKNHLIAFIRDEVNTFETLYREIIHRVVIAGNGQFVEGNPSGLRPMKIDRHRTGQSKKSQGGNISPIWGEAPLYRLKPKFACNLDDVITWCAKFQDNIFRSYNFTGGRISHFSIDLCIGLTTVQRYCAACDETKPHDTVSWAVTHGPTVSAGQ